MKQLLTHTSGFGYGQVGFVGPRAFMSDLFLHDYTKDKRGDERQAFFLQAKGELPGLPLNSLPGTNCVFVLDLC